MLRAMKKNIFFLIFLLVNLSAWAQKYTKADTLTVRKTQAKFDSLNLQPRLILLSRNYGDSVVLRWAPNRSGIWLKGIKNGYFIQRTEYSKENPKGITTLLTPQPLKALSTEAMRQRYGDRNAPVAAAQKTLYGLKNDKPFTGELGAVLERYDEQQQRYLVGLLLADFHPVAATVEGLRWVDKSPKKPEAMYVYKLWMNHNPTDTEALKDTASTVVFASEQTAVYAPFIDGIMGGDGAIVLRWLRMGADGNFSGFHIERSEDGQHFKRLTDAPFVQSPPDEEALKKDSVLFRNRDDLKRKVVYVDSVKVNYKKFYYRIIGVDAFGDLSPVSYTLEAMGRDYTPPKAPKNVKLKVVDNKSVVLTWERDGNEPDLKGFIIARGGNVVKTYKPLTNDILPPIIQTYTDPKPMPYSGNVYIVGAVDTAGNIRYTLPVAAQIEDRIPPTAPKGLIAKADTNGKITVSWQQGQDDDVVAYKLYRSYSRNNQSYNQLTKAGVADTMFVDSLPIKKMLNKEVFYKVVAIDLSHNHSVFSSEIMVKLSDKIPPSSPVAKDVKVTETGVQIEFVPSSSLDVTEHLIYRKEEKTDWKVVRRVAGKLTTNILFRDSLLTDQRQYEYAMAAVDEAGLVSPKSFGVPIKYIANSAPKDPVNLRISYDKERKAVIIQWDYTSSAISHFVLYRSENEQGLSQFHAIDGKSREYIDKEIKLDGRYEYAIRAFTTQGNLSNLSQKVQWTNK